MAFLADTSVLIGIVERGNPATRALIESSAGPWVASMVVRGELLFGIEQADASNIEGRTLTLETFDRLTEPPPVSGDDVYRTLPDLYGRISSLGLEAAARLGQNDRWVIAEASLVGASLVTEDREQARLARLWYERTERSLDVHLV